MTPVGERVPLPADAPAGAVTAWVYPRFPGLVVFRGARGAILRGSQLRGGGRQSRIAPTTPYVAARIVAQDRGAWIEYSMAEAWQARRLFRKFEESGSSLSPLAWLDAEIDRLVAAQDRADHLEREGLDPVDAERLALAFAREVEALL